MRCIRQGRDTAIHDRGVGGLWSAQGQGIWRPSRACWRGDRAAVMRCVTRARVWRNRCVDRLHQARPWGPSPFLPFVFPSALRAQPQSSSGRVQAANVFYPRRRPPPSFPDCVASHPCTSTQRTATQHNTTHTQTTTHHPHRHRRHHHHHDRSPSAPWSGLRSTRPR